MCRKPLAPSKALPSGATPDGSMDGPTSPGTPVSSVVRQRPIASKFSSENPSGSMLRWHVAQAGFRRWTSINSRTDVGGAPSSRVPRSGTSAGGSAGGAPSRFSSTHLPRDTGDVRLAYEVRVRMPAWPRMPARRSSAHVTRRKWLPWTSGIP